MKDDVTKRLDDLIKKKYNLPDDFEVTTQWLSEKLYEEDCKSTSFYFPTGIPGTGVVYNRDGTHYFLNNGKKEEPKML